MRDVMLDYLMGAHAVLWSDYFDLFSLHSDSTVEQRTAARENWQKAADVVQLHIANNYTRKPC